MGPSASSLGSDPPATAERVRAATPIHSSGYFVFSLSVTIANIPTLCGFRAIGLWGLGMNCSSCLVAHVLCCVPVL